jgi:AraC-like DNA-binding protein
MFKLDELFLPYDLKKLPGFQALLILEPFYRKNDNFSSKLVLDSIELKKAQVILDSILEEYQSKKDGYKSMIQSYLTTLIIFLSREYYFNKENYSKKIFKLSEVISFIETNYTENITVDMLSIMSCMSKRNFLRVFKHNYGATPIDYIMHLRFKRACELLKDSDISISQIALECGFVDSNYFSRQFKKYIGCTPTKWRSL